MRALRVVGLTEDGEVVLEDPVRLERFRVPADERLRAAARGDLSRLGQIAIELESQLRPREIQARIRAGESVEQVAAAAGVPEQKIERFAYPVLLERFRTAENAQRAHPVRADGPDTRTLADVVGHTFGLRGQAYEGARWDSWKGEDGRWVVALNWRAGRSDNRALWTFQPGAHGGTVTALDEHASDLVEGLPARPLRTVGAVVDMNRSEEEPPDAPSPVEQWRAAASDSYRERMPHAPDAPRPPSRPAETWRPAPPAQRQAEPVPEPRVAEPRGSYRGEPRPERPADRPRAGDGMVAQRTADSPRPGEGVAAPRTEAAAHGQGGAVGTAGAPAATAVAQRTAEGSRPVDGVVAPRAEAAAHGQGGPAEVAGSPAPAGRMEAPAAALGSPRPGSAEPAGTRPADTTPTASADGSAAAPPAPADDPIAAVAASAAALASPGGSATVPSTPTPDEAAPEAPATAGPAAEAPTPAADVPETDAPAPDAAPAPAASRRTKKGKPVMPSWDEVLLGVRGPR